jgi:iron complex outermembrane recepter protein
MTILPLRLAFFYHRFKSAFASALRQIFIRTQNMKFSRKMALAHVSTAFSALAIGLASPAMAQDAAADEPKRENAIDALNGEIVVVATKKANVENVQDVAISVTAFNEKSLEALKVRDLGSLSYSAPNVSLDQIGTSRGTANFSIRGLGINSSIPSIDPTVGVFVDGVYLGVNNGVSFDLFDIDSVEILRGPQGILFGRNTTGGAVLVNTGNPTNDLRVKAKVAIDGPVDRGRGAANVTVQGSVSGPIIKDVLTFKLGAYHNIDRGYFTNLFDGTSFGRAKTTILRGALELKPADGVRLLAKGEIFDSRGDGPAAQNHGIYRRDTFDFSVNNRGFYDSETQFGSLRADFDVGNGKITNIFGYRNYVASTDADIDSRPTTLFHSGTQFTQRQYSNELRYAGTFGPLDLTVGGFWFTQELKYDEQRSIPPSSPLTFYGGGRQDHDVLGVFAAADFNVSDALTLNAGLRWSNEEKNAAITYVRPRPACAVITGTCPVTGTNPFIPTEKNGFTNGRSWKNWAPKAGLQYKLGDNINLYSNWTRGYRSGGYNFRITAPIAFEAIVAANGGNFAFDEEKVDAYEAGVKFQTSDRKGTLNAAVFRTDIANMQREVNQSSGTTGVAQSIFNTADARIYGGELEGRYALTDNFLISGNFGIIDAKYKRILFDISGDGVINNTDLGLALPRVPKLTWGIGAIYDLELANGGSLVSRVSFQHRDRSAYTDNNYGFLTKSDQLEGSIAWKMNDLVTVSLYGKNLLDEVQHGGDTQIPFGGPLSDGTNVAFDDRPAAGTFSPLSKGRVVGLEATIAF